jgi:hypothetical protein
MLSFVSTNDAQFGFAKSRNVEESEDARTKIEPGGASESNVARELEMKGLIISLRRATKNLYTSRGEVPKLNQFCLM